MRLRSVVTGFLLTGALLAPAGEVLELEQSLEAALEHNFDLASARIRAALPEVRLAIEQSAFRWKVRPAVSVQQSGTEDTVTRLEGQIRKRIPTGALFQVRASWEGQAAGDEETVDVRLEQPLFRRYGRLDALRFVDAARHQVRMAQWSFQRETETLMLRVVRAYMEVLRQSGRLEQETLALTRAGELVRLVEIRRGQGRATEVELLEMRMLAQRAALRYRRTEESLAQSRLILAELLGRAPDQLPALAPPSLPDLLIPDLTIAETIAQTHRVDRLQVYASYEEARRSLRLQRRNAYPDVRLVANYQPVTTGEEQGDWTLGLVAGQEFDGVSTQLEIDQEEQAVQAALLAISAMELRLIREVRSAHAAVELAELERELASDQLEIARQRLKVSRSLYPLGRVTAQQLRDAEEAWVQADREELEARLRQTEEVFALWYTLGRMLESAGESEAAIGD